jgi:hypothetical protein
MTKNILNIEEIFEWNEVFGNLIPIPSENAKVVYIKSTHYVALFNFLKMDEKTYNERTKYNPLFIWMHHREYISIKYQLEPYHQEKESSIFDFFT